MHLKRWGIQSRAKQALQLHHDAEQGLPLQKAKQALPLHLGITIIEFITAISIIFVLAAALFPVLSKSRQMAKKRNAREVIHQLEVALRMYSEDYGVYPNDDSPNDNCGDIITVLENDTNGPYCEWPSDKVSGSDLLDPWNHSYIYRYPLSSSESSTGMLYRIWSIGPDGNDDNGDGDDIRNW